MRPDILLHHWPRSLILTGGFLLATAGLPGSSAVVDQKNFRIAGLVFVWGADGFDPAGNAPIVSDFVIDTGNGSSAATSGDTDLIAENVHTVVTGTLVPTGDAAATANGAPFRIQNIPGGGFTTDPNGDGVLTADDSFGAFAIRANSDINTRRAELYSSFYVASNVAFSIDGQATPLGATTPDAFDRMRVTLAVTNSGNDGLGFGSAAQYPHSAGPAGGSRANNRRLSTMTTPFNVFNGNQRTAVSRGSIADQSVRFDLTYRYNSGDIDLSDGVIEASAEVLYTVYVP